MAETLSYQPETTTETVESNLTPEEQDSLAVGEKLQGEQEALLAGKYKDAAAAIYGTAASINRTGWTAS